MCIRTSTFRIANVDQLQYLGVRGRIELKVMVYSSRPFDTARITHNAGMVFERTPFESVIREAVSRCSRARCGIRPLRHDWRQVITLARHWNYFFFSFSWARDSIGLSLSSYREWRFRCDMSGGASAG